jgi:hypothetical protein
MSDRRNEGEGEVRESESCRERERKRQREREKILWRGEVGLAGVRRTVPRRRRRWVP